MAVTCCRAVLLSTTFKALSASSLWAHTARAAFGTEPGSPGPTVCRAPNVGSDSAGEFPLSLGDLLASWGSL